MLMFNRFNVPTLTAFDFFTILHQRLSCSSSCTNVVCWLENWTFIYFLSSKSCPDIWTSRQISRNGRDVCGWVMVEFGRILRMFRSQVFLSRNGLDSVGIGFPLCHRKYFRLVSREEENIPISCILMQKYIYPIQMRPKVAWMYLANEFKSAQNRSLAVQEFTR